MLTLAPSHRYLALASEQMQVMQLIDNALFFFIFSFFTVLEMSVCNHLACFLRDDRDGEGRGEWGEGGRRHTAASILNTAVFLSIKIVHDLTGHHQHQ